MSRTRELRQMGVVGQWLGMGEHDMGGPAHGRLAGAFSPVASSRPLRLAS